MPNSTIQYYFNDSSIPYAKRAKAFQDIENGTLNEDQFAQSLTQHFGQNYGQSQQSTDQSQPQGQTVGGQIQSQTSTSQQPSQQDQQNVQQQAQQASQDATMNAAFGSLGGANVMKAAQQGGQQMTQGAGEVGQGIQEAFGHGQITNPNGAAQGRPWEALPTPGLGTPQQMQEGSQKSFKGLEDIVGGGLGTAFSPVSGAIESIPNDQIKAGVKSLANTPSWVISSIGKWAAKQVNPNLTEDQLHEFVGKPLETATNLGLAAFAPEAAEAAGKVLGKAGEVAGKVAKGGGEVAKSGLSMASGLGKGTIETALENPTELAEAQKTGIEANRTKTAEMIKTPIDQMKEQLSDNGQAYKPIRDASTTVNLGDNWLDNQLQQHGLSVDDNGQIQATTKSAVRNPADISAIQKFYDLWNNKGNGGQIDSDEFLNMRSDLADIAKYDATGKTGASADFAKNTRSALNDVGRPQIQGLEQIDNTHSDLIDRLDQIKNLIYKDDGTLQDKAVSNINNLLNKGKEGALSKIQEALPDFDMDKFAKQVKVTKALEDIETGKGVKIGAYAHNLGATLSAATANIPGIIGSILTHPTVLIPILQKAGEVAGKTSDFVGDITDKVMNGEKPTGEAAQFVTKALKQVKPKTIQVLVRQAAVPQNK